MNQHSQNKGIRPAGDRLREAVRWMSESRRHDLAAVEEASRRFDLSPLDEEFLIAEARRIARDETGPARSGTSVVSRPDEAGERDTAEGVRILESWNLPADPSASIARARLPPGEHTRWHYLVDTVERYLVVSGFATVELGDREPEPVGPGDVVFIPAGVAQRVRCTGPGECIFYCVCTPRFEERNYREGKPGGG